MRSTRLAVPALAAGAALLLAGCSAGADADGDREVQTLQIAAVTSPMTDVVLAAAEAVDEGYEIELVEVSDYVTANTILDDGDVFANFSQHLPYLQTFNEANDAALVGIQPVYNFSIAFYSRTISDVADLPDGAVVAIPDDSSNTGRALTMLDDAGVVALDEAVDRYAATLDDIVENPKGLEFLQVAITQLNTAYEEVDLVFQWPSHIAALGLNPEDDGLLVELDDTFELNVVVREEDADTAAAEALRSAFSSGEVREVIESNGTIVAAF